MKSKTSRRRKKQNKWKKSCSGRKPGANSVRLEKRHPLSNKQMAKLARARRSSRALEKRILDGLRSIVDWFNKNSDIPLDKPE